MMNSRLRSSPKRGRISSRNFTWIWYSVSGSSLYERSSLRTRAVMSSSWVGPRQNSRS